MATKNAGSIRDHVRAEMNRRFAGNDRIDMADLEIVAVGSELVLRGMVDDAYARTAVERVAREILGQNVKSELAVRDDIGSEASAKATEFGSTKASRATTGRRGMPS